jgi:hypothetical protein
MEAQITGTARKFRVLAAHTEFDLDAGWNRTWMPSSCRPKKGQEASWRWEGGKDGIGDGAGEGEIPIASKKPRAA